MQELRFVLIIVGAIAIAALLFHGLWTSKREVKTKFGSKPLRKLDVGKEKGIDPDSIPETNVAPEDDFEIIRKVRKEPDFIQDNIEADPLIDGYSEPESNPLFSSNSEVKVADVDDPFMSSGEAESFATDAQTSVTKPDVEAQVKSAEQDASPQQDIEVIVLNVHCSGSEPLVGTKLFDSMQQNGLLYGEMDIFHRHSDLSGTGKVLFSVANMMQPGTLAHSDPAEFTTKGISFFMTLPCYGDPEQNFKLMLKTAQQIADDLGANVLDDARNLMTPSRLDAYRAQIQEFKSLQSA
ncbi:cell division protein ZipA [Vibrio zhanjiangensis]|uniref:Cell division protein ZipA n=1 Tax=Vibrio zhanjiangensis TaxID=1046128 RepID=A0ABQ6EUC9_9VIBR|nr:cell division protein ZipA [Vibrio zhanjiangensis]GLT16765.1 cell division protein ZipA [Vibrio zhanjiangensis]